MKLSSLKPLTLAVTSTLFVAACSDSVDSTAGAGFNGGNNNGGNQTQFDENALLTHLTNNVITPKFNEFETVANSLEQAVSTYCQSEQGFNNGSITEQQRDTDRTSAQNAWLTSMNQWQQIEVMQLGPLIANQSLLKNNIYSWPVVSTCAVDQDVAFFNAGNINGTPYDISNRVFTRRGLDALEYLLFNTNLAHSCTANTAPAGWDALTDAARREQRCQFAVAVAGDIANSAQQLLDAWGGANGYAQSLLNAANAPGSDFNNVHEAVNRISDGMFYIDSIAKDAKLGIPLGLFDNSCQQNVCPEDRESQFANHSLQNIRNNLVSLRTLFTGEVTNSQVTLGFDDFLVEEGASATATNMLNAINNAIANIDTYQATLGDTLQNDSAQVQATHDQVKAITDQMKADFINQLSLELPATSAGDND
ncbi:imelysin family protein [Pleionea sp. CnH1-48]|uniref:imelysin family protein n=1 Tax=Pleionea sp. CnH1-48 TaxID=2954494 RepID=UPI00209855E6|nr:imelysin family protein [Pleionea sp. CnH1-48]MCO7223339.1 imelysin family protein [Pleionea sp. CnH1-48]